MLVISHKTPPQGSEEVYLQYFGGRSDGDIKNPPPQGIEDVYLEYSEERSDGAIKKNTSLQGNEEDFLKSSDGAITQYPTPRL